MVKPLFSSFRMITAKFSSARKFRNFTVDTHCPNPEAILLVMLEFAMLLFARFAILLLAKLAAILLLAILLDRLTDILFTILLVSILCLYHIRFVKLLRSVT